MAIGQAVKQTSFLTLGSSYEEAHGALDVRQSELLRQVNELFAVTDLVLSKQSKAVENILFKAVSGLAKKVNLNTASAQVEAQINEQLAAETYQNQNSHRRQGRFNVEPLHSRSLRNQMQDHDMTRFMPKSSGNIDVLAPVNRFEDTALLQEAIQEALANEEISHVVIPVGPGHWRGVYLSKPSVVGQLYRLELFDPCGPNGAKAIQPFAEKLLAECGIAKEKVDIEFTGPPVKQADGYACGDFVCGRSHELMKSLGADASAFNEDVISAYQRGNGDNALRQFNRKLSRGNSPIEPTAHAESRSVEPSSDTHVNTEVVLNDEEKRVFNKTIESFSNVSSTSHYKQELVSLIKSRGSLFSQMDGISKKEKSETALSDEELATKLQVEEFKAVGLKP